MEYYIILIVIVILIIFLLPCKKHHNKHHNLFNNYIDNADISIDNEFHQCPTLPDNQQCSNQLCCNKIKPTEYFDIPEYIPPVNPYIIEHYESYQAGITTGNRINLLQTGSAGGGQNIFTGLNDPSDANGRGQILINSAYSDLIIASSQDNDWHGSTISFVDYNPGNVNDYTKWVINKGNYGSKKPRREFLSFGYSANTSNPHSSVAANASTLILDGNLRKVGINVDNPAYALNVVATYAGDWTARFGIPGEPVVYLAHRSGNGMHINTFNKSSTNYALQLHNNEVDLVSVYNNQVANTSCTWNFNNQVNINNNPRSGTGNQTTTPLYITGDIASNGSGVAGLEVRHSNQSQGIAIGYAGLWATGTNTNQDFHIGARGTGLIYLDSIVSISGDLNTNGHINIQGTSRKHLRLWNAGDTNWGMYMSESGGGISMGGGTACASVGGVGWSFGSHAIRFRGGGNGSTTNGFIWETCQDDPLMSLRCDGYLQVKNEIASRGYYGFGSPAGWGGGNVYMYPQNDNGRYGNWRMGGGRCGNWSGIHFEDSRLYLMMGNNGDLNGGRCHGVWAHAYGDWMWRCENDRQFYMYNNLTVSGNIAAVRTRVYFAAMGDGNHCIYNNNNNLDGQGGWDGMKINTGCGLRIQVWGRDVINVDDGSVRIGTDSCPVYIGGNKTGNFIRFNDDLWFYDPQNGTIQIRNGNGDPWGTMVGYFNNPSSRTYKKNIVELTKEKQFQMYNDTKNTSIFSWLYNEDEEDAPIKYGPILEESPDYFIVTKDKKSLFMTSYVSMLHAALQVSIQKIETLEKDNKNLKNDINAIKKYLNI